MPYDQKITPFLWFNNNAEEAINYYVSVFKNSRVISLAYYPDESLDEHFVGMKGRVIDAHFELNGQQFRGLDGGDEFRFTEAISLFVSCENQEEVDYFWEKLSHVPESEQCGWCKDQFGLSWQIIPTRLAELMSDPDSRRSGRAVQAMMKMKKIDIAALEAAADSVS